MLPSFSHAIPAARIHCGADCLKHLPAELDRLKASRAVIFCGATLGGSAELKQVIAALGSRHAGTFAGVRAHSPLPAVLQGSRFLRECAADAVVAIGGGSAIVTARASTILLAEGENIDALCTQYPHGRTPVSPKLNRPKLPQIVIPTTPSTAYAKAGSAVRDPDAGRRLTLFDPKTRAQVVLLHPDLALTAPAPLFIDAGFQAMATAAAGLESPRHESLADALLMHALRLYVEHLPRVASDDAAAARLELLIAGFMAGQGTDFSPAGVAASITHAIGARYGVPNGACNALVLPATLRYNATVTAHRLPLLADALGAGRITDTDAALQATCEAIVALLKTTGAPTRLRDVGIERDALRDLAEHAMEDWFVHLNPRRISSIEELTSVLERAW